MTLELRVRPAGLYSLRDTARHASDATRIFRDGVLTACVPGRDGPELVRAWQRPDGEVELRAASDEGVERLRFVLALDSDHGELVRRFAGDELIGPALKALPGMRQLRTATVAHAVLRALAGQLIDSSRARALERVVVRRTTRAHEGLHAAPTGADFAALAPAQLCAVGLSARKASTLVRFCAAGDPERLHSVPSAAVLARFERERGLGPWSAGVVALEGLGRHDLGLVGDLGLVKLLGAMRGRRVEGWETAELLEPYGQWAGLASVYLLHGPKPEALRPRAA